MIRNNPNQNQSRRAPQQRVNAVNTAQPSASNNPNVTANAQPSASNNRSAPQAVKTAQGSPSNNRNVPGNKPPPATTTNKDFVLCLWNNDLPDCDNALVLDVWTKMVRAAEAKFNRKECAVKKITVFELNKVNLAIDRIDGADIGTTLAPMCAALFKEDGIVKKLEAEIKQDSKLAQKDPKFAKVVADLSKVQKTWAFSNASIFMQAGLPTGLEQAMVKDKKIMKELRSIKFKTYQDKACSCDEKRPGMTCNPCILKNEWIQEQLEKMVPSEDPPGWKEDSIMAGKLVAQDFLKGLAERKLLGSGDKFYLDVDGLAEIDAPLERRMEHPSFLVNYEKLASEYKTVIKSSKSDGLKRQEIRGYMEKKLEDAYTDRMAYLKNTPGPTGPHRYQPIIDEAKKAKRIIMFGGSSLTLLSKLMSENFAHKIDFVGQGGTSDPKLNLTGNPFNWELNLWATYDVLSRHVKGPNRLGSFQLGTTELGKRVVFKGQDLAGEFHDRFGRRVAAFGVQGIKTNPERVDLRGRPEDKGKKYLEHFTKDGKPVSIMCPDLVALFAAFAETKFRKTYCKLSPETKMFITSEERVRNINGQAVKGRRAKRVQFGRGSEKVGEELNIRDREGSPIIKPWDPRPETQQFVATDYLGPIIQECIDTFVRQVAEALGRPVPADEPDPVPQQKQDSTTLVTSLAKATLIQDPVKHSATASRTQSGQGDRTAEGQVRQPEHRGAHQGGTPSHGVGSGNRRQGTGLSGSGHSEQPGAKRGHGPSQEVNGGNKSQGQSVNGTAPRAPSRTAGSVSGGRVMGGTSGTANGTSGPTARRPGPPSRG